MIDIDDYFGGLTREEYEKETEEHFEWLENTCEKEETEKSICRINDCELLMCNKKYRLMNIVTDKYNPIHEPIIGKICFPAYFNIGERGWFLYKPYDLFDRTEKVHTSVVEYYIKTPEGFTVQTNNSKYVFKVEE